MTQASRLRNQASTVLWHRFWLGLYCANLLEQNSPDLLNRVGIIHGVVAGGNDQFRLGRVELGLQYGTTPSELFGVSPLPRSPMIEFCGDSIGSLSREINNGFLGDSPDILVGGRNFLGSLFGATAVIKASGKVLRILIGSRIRLTPSAPTRLVESALPR